MVSGRLLLVVVVLGLVVEVAAQRRDFNYRFVAKIVEADSMQGIGNCHVMNLTQRIGTVSDERGSFTLTANKGDSVEIRALGYATRRIAIADSMYSNRCVLAMEAVAYPIEEVKVGVLSTYDRFKAGVLGKENATGYPIDLPVDVSRLPIKRAYTNVDWIEKVSSPITTLYNMFSEEGKRYRHYLSVIKGEAEYIVLGRKFNGYLVHQLTGLEDDELIAFMSYCMFTKEYLHETSEAEINRQILQKFKRYLQEKGEWKIQEGK